MAVMIRMISACARNSIPGKTDDRFSSNSPYHGDPPDPFFTAVEKEDQSS